MANVIILSSWVGCGHVGISASQPVLQILGHRVIALPTVMLSNHRAFPHCGGAVTPVATLREMAQAMAGNGWFQTVDCLMTGYLPSADHVAFAAELASAMPETAQILVDPVLGDDPKGLYLPLETAQALRNELLPRAQILTPNRFELAWLTGAPCDTVTACIDAAQTLMPAASAIHVTSPPLAEATGVLSVTPNSTALFTVPKHADVPNGTGDVFAALIASGLAAGAALGHLSALVKESIGAPHLRIAETAATWTQAQPLHARDPDGL